MVYYSKDYKYFTGGRKPNSIFVFYRQKKNDANPPEEMTPSRPRSFLFLDDNNKLPHSMTACNVGLGYADLKDSLQLRLHMLL